MKRKSVEIRVAQPKDALDIWHLLHSDSKDVSMTNIESKPEDFYVLLYGSKLLAVYDNRFHGIDQAQRIAIHPLYPQKLLEDVMTTVVKVIL